MKAVLGLAVAIAALACLGAQGAPPPTDQHAPEVDPPDTQCSGERVLVGSPDGRPACVTPSTARTLLERGWHEMDRSGPGYMPVTPAKTLTVQSDPWTVEPWGPFAEIEKQPGSRTETADGLEPGWSGKQVAYRVFEWVGKQKLYSDEVSFVPQAR